MSDSITDGSHCSVLAFTSHSKSTYIIHHSEQGIREVTQLQKAKPLLIIIN